MEKQEEHKVQHNHQGSLSSSAEAALTITALTICDGHTEQGLRSDNLISGFRKCGIVPLDRKPVLSRLPSEATEGLVCDPVAQCHEHMSDSVVKVLKEMRYGSQSQEGRQQANKRSRLNIQPGRSISWEDINHISKQQTAGTGTAGTSSNTTAVQGTSNRKQLTKVV